jgi:hypothetical protein
MTKAQLTAAAMDDQPLEVTRQFRGTQYKLRAISMTDYDKSVAQATQKDQETGEDEFDPAKHTRILLSKSLVEPEGMTVVQLYDKDPKLVRGVQKMLQELYWDDEPDELTALKADAEKHGDDDEGEAAAAS